MSSDLMTADEVISWDAVMRDNWAVEPPESYWRSMTPNEARRKKAEQKDEPMPAE